MDPRPGGLRTAARPVRPMLAAGRRPLPDGTRAGRTSSSGTASGPWSTSRADGSSLRRATAATDRLVPRAAGAGRVARDHPSAVLDGEIVVLDEDGRPSFGLLQHRMHVADAAAGRAAWPSASPVTLVVFDLLHLDGRRRCLDLPYASAVAARVASGPGARAGRSRRVRRRARSRGAARPPAEPGWRAWWPSGATAATGRAERAATG